MGPKCSEKGVCDLKQCRCSGEGRPEGNEETVTRAGVVSGYTDDQQETGRVKLAVIFDGDGIHLAWKGG